MSFIKVPIGRGIISQIQEKPQTGITAQSELQFFKDLAVDGRLVTNSSTRTTSGTVATIIPPNGSTFYFLEASYSGQINNVGNPVSFYQLIKDGNVIERIDVKNDQTTSGRFETPFDSLVGNGTRSYDIEFTFDAGQTGNASGTICGYLENTLSFR